ncbi:MAG: hypothetical protein A2161_09100 [Candidatus Schekmanbacteria bacterium RBG_13_48_7]|uniref:Uncharacterized protein n=1 Tax=Candidatus Schekmanbacteria bacterium RBG_13_48_7 TaxID=1817878 RepID=A0A1F7S132_9BACT|nr:MAG: hypothetical protein A2161_09100 [Candidatus Schekmanbacteria bacterium RBG_13_48_7]
MTARKGYAYRKAIQQIAYEKGKRKTVPSMPKSRAMKGAIESWKRKLQKGYIPKNEKMKELVERTYRKYDFGEKYRVGINFGGQIFSGSKFSGIPEALMNFFGITKKEKIKYSRLFVGTDFEDIIEDFSEFMYIEISNYGIDYNKYKFWKWNRTLKSIREKFKKGYSEIELEDFEVPEISVFKLKHFE